MYTVLVGIARRCARSSHGLPYFSARPGSPGYSAKGKRVHSIIRLSYDESSLVGGGAGPARGEARRTRGRIVRMIFSNRPIVYSELRVPTQRRANPPPAGKEGPRTVMKFCSAFTGIHGGGGAPGYRPEWLAELSVLTKEKLRHYLAFECAIREIAAVSDRHCLATDRPRTSVPSTLRPDLRDGARCVCSLASLPHSLLSPLRHSQLSPRLVCRVLNALANNAPPPFVSSSRFMNAM